MPWPCGRPGVRAEPAVDLDPDGHALRPRSWTRLAGDTCYGSTGFLFTDDLDVTNRFYDDLRDAEGGQSRIRRSRAASQCSRACARQTLPQQAERYRDGQSWDLVQRIGRHLASGPATQASCASAGHRPRMRGSTRTPTSSWRRRPGGGVQRPARRA